MGFVIQIGPGKEPARADLGAKTAIKIRETRPNSPVDIAAVPGPWPKSIGARWARAPTTAPNEIGSAVTGRPTGDGTLRLTLDVDTRTQPISGRITGGTRQWRFSGWLELAVALQAAIAEQPAGERPDHPP